MYDKIAEQLGITKQELRKEFKRRHAYTLDDEVKAIADIKAGVFVDYSNFSTRIEDEIGTDRFNDIE